MANLAGDIIAALYTDIYTESETGGDLDWMSRHAVWVMPQESVQEDIITAAPFILIYPQEQTLTPANMSCYRSDDKTFRLSLSLFCEFDDPTIAWTGTTGRTGMRDMIDTLETRYNRNKLGLSNSSLSCFLRSIRYNQPGFPGFFQATLELDYQYLDERDS